MTKQTPVTSPIVASVESLSTAAGGAEQRSTSRYLISGQSLQVISGTVARPHSTDRLYKALGEALSQYGLLDAVVVYTVRMENTAQSSADRGNT